MRGVTPLARDTGVTGSHQLGMGDVAAGMGVTGVTDPPGMLAGDIMPAGNGPLVDDSVNGDGGSYRRGLFGPSMMYGAGELTMHWTL
jgi:hypothetical protein